MRAEFRPDRPVFHRVECVNLTFTVNDQPQSHRLNAPGREAATHFFPQDWAYAVPNQPIQHTPRLLGIDQIHVDRARVREGFIDGIFSDLMKNYPLCKLLLNCSSLQQMPGNGFPFAVRVRSQVDFSSFFRQLFKFFNNRLLLVRDAVLWRKIIFHIY